MNSALLSKVCDNLQNFMVSDEIRYVEIPDDFDMNLLSEFGIYHGKIHIDGVDDTGKTVPSLRCMTLVRKHNIKMDMLRDIDLQKCLREISELLTEIYNAPGMPGYIRAQTSYNKLLE